VEDIITPHLRSNMGEVLTLVTKPEKVKEDIKSLLSDLSSRIDNEDPEKNITVKKAVILLLDDEMNSSNYDHYDFTMISANLSTSELVGLLEIAKYRAFTMEGDE
tara:strand:+ start:2305 stop:2619 length:315 start_codon:yes stop_codon:yes gene_type:complete